MFRPLEEFKGLTVKIELGVFDKFVPIPMRSVLASTKNKFVSPSPSTLKSTDSPSSLNTLSVPSIFNL